MTRFEYDSIRRPLFNAFTAQALSRQDVEQAGHPNPEEIADPYNVRLVLRGRRRMIRAPENYTGVYDNGRMVAFLKTGDWNIPDELPFSTEDERTALEALAEDGFVTTPQEKLGIFGLVIVNTLPQDAQFEIADRLLDIATDRGLHLGKSAINITFHEKDTVTAVAKEHGFAFTGRIGQPNGVPGIDQRLYSKPLDL